MIRKKTGSHFHALDLDDPELSILLTDDETIRRLNAEWRDEDSSTDVLSFPVDAAPGTPMGPEILGDIVINLDYAERLVESREHHARVAEELGVDESDLDWSLEDEVHFLLIHGLLHLVGHGHLEPEDAREMKEAERRLWEAAQKVG